MKYFYEYIDMLFETHKPISNKLRKALNRIPHYIDSYYWNEEYVDALIAFIENNLYLQKGDRIPFILLPEQKFWVGMLGFENEEHVPVVSDLGIIIGAGSGKSTFMAALSLAVMMVGAHYGNDVLVLSNSKEQSQELFRTASEMCSDDKGGLYIFKKLGMLRPVINKIFFDPTNSVMQVKAMDNKTADGVNVRMAVFDEFHAYQDNVIENIKKSAAPKRSKTGFTTVYISTNGQTRDLVFDDYMRYWEKVLNVSEDIIAGIRKIDDKELDDSVFPIIYQYNEKEVGPDGEPLPDDDINDMTLYPKAMPFIYDISDPKIIYNHVLQADDNPVAMAEIMAKCFNIPQSAYNALFGHKELLNCYKLDTHDIDFGSNVYVGYDLSAVDDLSVVVIVYRSGSKFKVIQHSFIPRSTYNKRTDEKHRSLYDRFIHEDSLTLLDSDIVDYQSVFDWLTSYIYTNNLYVNKVIGDAFYAVKFQEMCKQEWGEERFMTIKQNTMYLSEPLKYIKSLVKNTNIKLTDRLLVWTFGNLNVRVDHNDNIFPAKDKKSDKIDPVSATIAAIYGWINETNDDLVNLGSLSF